MPPVLGTDAGAYLGLLRSRRQASQCSTDGRVTRVGLTDKGWEAIDKIQKATDKLFTQSYQGLTEPQIQKFNKVLQTIFENLPEE